MSFGPSLREAREALGLSISDLAQRTKIRGDYLKALEEEDISALPERTFSRSYVQRYARELGIDAAPLLVDFDRAMPLHAAAVQHREVSAAAPEKTASAKTVTPVQPAPVVRETGAPAPQPKRAVWPWVLGALALLGAPLLFFTLRPAPAPAPKTVQVTPPDPEPRPEVKPEAVQTQTVRLTVVSQPVGARVYLDKRDLGMTPVESFPVDSREKGELRVEMDGREPLKEDLDLTTGRYMRAELVAKGKGTSKLVDVNAEKRAKIAAAKAAAAKKAAAKAAAAKKAAQDKAAKDGATADKDKPASDAATDTKDDKTAEKPTQDKDKAGSEAETKKDAAKPQSAVSLTFTGESWTRITDAAGRVLYEGTPPVGSVKGFPAGVTVRTGNAGAVQVSVKGAAAKALGPTGQVITRKF